MTIFVQMPKEEYDALKAKADRRDEEVRKKVGEVFDTLVSKMKQYPNISYHTFVDFMDRNRDKFIEGALDKMEIHDT